ncbi:MAG: hypothetical protein K0S79_1819 [Nitrospira sp.]|jgi:hypothetical protein|nr:hypothetical protein [Nitrospira sp.]
MVERRKIERIPVTFRASFGGTLAGLREGIVTDVTMSGCRLESHAPVPVNTYLELWLEISPIAPRIVVELAAVRWVRNNQCGIEFLGLRPKDKAQLERLIEWQTTDGKD